MKFLSTFKISKGFDTWLNMYKDIEPDLNKLGIKILWAGTNSDETKVYDVTEVKDPAVFDILTYWYTTIYYLLIYAQITY